MAKTEEITKLILEARDRARSETSDEPEPGLTTAIEWPVTCSVGPGLEGAIACESKVGYVNGTKGWLIYRGYDIFDLCAWSSYEEVSYLLLHGRLPNATQLQRYKDALYSRLFITETQRLLLSFPIQDMNPMAALRLGTNLMRQKQTYRDRRVFEEAGASIASDEDSIAMETTPIGEQQSVYEFVRGPLTEEETEVTDTLVSSEELASCYNLVAGIVSVATTIGRVRSGRLPLEPLPDLSLAGNYLYMLTGRRPSALEERIMDVCFILHADHGMNASTFAAMVVASTLSDIYLAIGAGVSALAGPLHGGANVEVIKMLTEIGRPEQVDAWYESARRAKRKITGFGHRVYKAYDPRARILGPLAKLLTERSATAGSFYSTARALESKVISSLGESKGIFPNVDFYSGLVYRSMGIPPELYTTIFAVSRVSGWAARVVEYLQNNRIFRPRAIYTGTFNEQYVPVSDR
ncbi:MAG: citrate/2-methylcitrate synthase [Spirochaetota bacterium]